MSGTSEKERKGGEAAIGAWDEGRLTVPVLLLRDAPRLLTRLRGLHADLRPATNSWNRNHYQRFKILPTLSMFPRYPITPDSHVESEISQYRLVDGRPCLNI
jgi:hypothetical protein